MLSLEAAATMAREMGRLVERSAIRGWTLKSTRRVAMSVGGCATESARDGREESRERERKTKRERERENTGEFTSPGEFLQDLISRVHVRAHMREYARRARARAPCTHTEDRTRAWNGI